MGISVKEELEGLKFREKGKVRLRPREVGTRQLREAVKKGSVERRCRKEWRRQWRSTRRGKEEV